LKVYKRPGGTILKKSKRQVGKPVSIKKDKEWAALAPGKRRSKKGNIYYEYRANRSDLGSNL